MIDQFKVWMNEVVDEAINEKRNKARDKGDESKWMKEIWKSPAKNKSIKAKFRDKGFDLGYNSRPSYKSKAGEWLYDFIWREFDEDDNFLNLILAMEIEVSDKKLKHIKYDFNKLLQAEAQYKILVFQLKTEDEIQNAFNYFENAAEKYCSKSNSEFLLCGWCTSKNNFFFRDFHQCPK